MTAEKNGMKMQLADFVEAHPHGWGHADWEGLLGGLRTLGFDVGDTEAIGLELERERVRNRLNHVSGMGPKRLEALTARFPRIWDLQRASVEDLAAIPSIPRSLAEKLREALS